jgi:hypothetical protein
MNKVMASKSKWAAFDCSTICNVVNSIDVYCNKKCCYNRRREKGGFLYEELY